MINVVIKRVLVKNPVSLNRNVAKLKFTSDETVEIAGKIQRAIGGPSIGSPHGFE